MPVAGFWGLRLLFILAHSPSTSMRTLFWESLLQSGVVVSRSFWNLPDLLTGMGPCISMSGKRGRRGVGKRKIKCIYSLPLCAQMFPLWTPSLHRGITGHKQMGSGSWLSRELDLLVFVLGSAWEPSRGALALAVLCDQS